MSGRAPRHSTKESLRSLDGLSGTQVGDCVAKRLPDDPAIEIWEGQPGRIEWFEPDPPS